MRIHGRKLTREERKILTKNNLDTYVWLVQSHTPNELKIIHKETGEVKILQI